MMIALLLSIPLAQGAGLDRPASFAEILDECRGAKPTELYELTRVVDGDTLWIKRNGELEKLRLLSVDTEEKLSAQGTSASKPGTAFGERCTGWAQGFLCQRGPTDPEPRVGLVFPSGEESRDVYGRLLCHVVTQEGVDFNLLLVRSGMSPYFNKYGHSKIRHRAFVAAQQSARAEGLGVWDPDTNRGGLRRPYARLLPWWDARAQALAEFRAKSKDRPLDFVEADDAAALAQALANGPRRITAIGLVDRTFDEDDGSLTILLRGGDKRRSLRVKIAAGEVRSLARIDLLGSRAEFRQNYLLFQGRLEQGQRGFALVDVKTRQIERAGPEPSK